jgi:hypothetical protein
MIRIVAMGEDEPGMRPLAAALEDEGFNDLDGGGLVESFARHLMAAVDTCQHRGFGEVAKTYLSRLAPRNVEPGKGDPAKQRNAVRHDIDEQGNLRPGMVRRRVEQVDGRRAGLLLSWLDPVTGVPRR